MIPRRRIPAPVARIRSVRREPLAHAGVDGFGVGVCKDRLNGVGVWAGFDPHDPIWYSTRNFLVS